MEEAPSITYSRDEINGIYELGKLYFEMGFFVPAERIFSGILAVDDGFAAARLALGLLRIERGLVQEGIQQLRELLQSGSYAVEARLGLCLAFLSLDDVPRAQTLVAELRGEIDASGGQAAAVKQLWEALEMRCSNG